MVAGDKGGDCKGSGGGDWKVSFSTTGEVGVVEETSFKGDWVWVVVVFGWVMGSRRSSGRCTSIGCTDGGAWVSRLYWEQSSFKTHLKCALFFLNLR